jgi:hypothetical protein
MFELQFEMAKIVVFYLTPHMTRELFQLTEALQN